LERSDRAEEFLTDLGGLVEEEEEGESTGPGDELLDGFVELGDEEGVVVGVSKRRREVAERFERVGSLELGGARIGGDGVVRMEVGVVSGPTVCEEERKDRVSSYVVLRK